MRSKMRFFSRFVGLLWALLLMIPIITAQESLAGVLRVTYPGVEVQRVNTSQWLELPEGAQAGVGPGDVIRTGEFGRAMLQYGDGIHVFLLPQTDFTVGNVTRDAEGAYAFEGRVMGLSIHQTAPDVDLTRFSLHMEELIVTQPAPLFAVWSRVDLPDAVTVAEGEALVSASVGDVAVGAGQGFLDDGVQTVATPIDAPYSAPRIEATLYGCPGTVKVVEEFEDLRVRSGPGLDYFAVGLVGDGLPVSLMNRNETGDWTRIQFRSYFGWVYRLALNADCPDLEVLPDRSPVEPIRQFVDVTPQEAAILAPFFLPQDEDRYRYQFAE